MVAGFRSDDRLASYKANFLPLPNGDLDEESAEEVDRSRLS